MSADVLVAHGGDLMAVINASLCDVAEEAKKSGSIGKVYGAIDGSGGILKENLLDLIQVPEGKLSLLFQIPTTAVGLSWYTLRQKGYNAMTGVFRRHGIRYVLLNSGNGTMDTYGHVFKACGGEDIHVAEIPKAIDNGIAITDHTSGCGNAARFIAASTTEVGADVRALPIHVRVMEAMGRNAGWVTAASALVKKRLGDAPHLIYLLERFSHEEEFLEDAKRLYEEKRGVVAVASKGLKNEKRGPIMPPAFKAERATYYGGVSAYLANLVIQELGIKARSEKPGLCGGASIV